MNQTQITRQAKQIIDSFAKALEKIKIKPKSSTQKTGGFREESEPQSPNQEFKKHMFSNAPETQGDFLINEKKKWQ